MASSDLDTLVDMGFDKERSELALKSGGGLQGAIDWLDKNQDKSLDEIKEESRSEADGMPELKPGEEAKSLVCEDCGKKLRSHAQAEFHASKTGHENFSESTEEFAPLTQEEKDSKLAALREKLAEKRAVSSEQDKAERKRNEQIRRKSTKETQDAKEDLQRKEQMKQAEAKRQEKKAEVDAKRRIQAKIQEDKDERKRKAEQEKAARVNQTFPPEEVQSTIPDSVPTPVNPKPSKTHSEARLRLTTDNGAIQKNFPAETTLFEVAVAVAEEKGIEVESFSSNFPRKTFDKTDFGMTLKEAGFVPSAALIVK